MRVIELSDGFGLENLRPAERPEPRPGPGQVLLRMRAVSINYRDLLMVRGHYNPRQPLPLIPCSDGVGEVVETGEGVTRVEVGDRVAPIFAQAWLSGEPTPGTQRTTLGGPLDGTLAQLMVLDASGVVRVPEHLSDEAAATLPCAAVTAWSALKSFGALRAGETLLIQGTGGVSIFALQFAALAGAKAIVTSSSDEKLRRARELGAWKTINYRTHEDWGTQVKELTGGRGVDHVVEVGGANTLTQSLTAVRFGGRISLIGVLSGVASELSVIPILMQQITIQGVLVGHRDGFEEMNRAIAEHRLEPVVDRVFELEQAREALEHLAAGRHLGKVCIRFS